MAWCAQPKTDLRAMETRPTPVGDNDLFASEIPDAPGEGEKSRQNTGIYPSQEIEELIRGRKILAAESIADPQIQPASLDLRLGRTAYRVNASFLPGPDHSVRDRIDAFAQYEIDLADGGVLEQGHVYIVPLLEQLDLPRPIGAYANPKSSAGRLDIFTRVITDNSPAFDRIAAGYRGPLYAEISPRTFSVRVRTGTRLNQLRLRRGAPTLSKTAMRALQTERKLSTDGSEIKLEGDKLNISLDLGGSGPDAIVGYKAKKNCDVIDVDRVAHYPAADFWEPIRAPADGGFVLNVDDFYILASREAVSVPPDHAAEMIPYDTLVGEFRVHYAGFFDPGFGSPEAGGTGSKAVLEVRPHEVPFFVEDGQVVGRLVYEKLRAVPDRLYGKDLGSNYQAQGLRLSKHFRM